MDSEDEDQHMCLNCHALLTGLQNYINHRKNECPNRRAPVGRNEHPNHRAADTQDKEALISAVFQLPEDQHHRSSASQDKGAGENVSMTQNHDVIRNSISGVNQSKDLHNSNPEQQSNDISYQNHTENATRGDSLVSLPTIVNSSSSDVNSAPGPATNHLDPNRVFTDADKQHGGLHGGNLNGVKSQISSKPLDKNASLDLENIRADDISIYQSPSDSDQATTLRIVNILNDLGFSSESEEESADCDNSVDVLDAKTRESVEESADCDNSVDVLDAKTRESVEDKADIKDEVKNSSEVDLDENNSSAKSLYCKVCNRTLGTRHSYDHHMQTKLHLNRCKDQGLRRSMPKVPETIDCLLCNMSFNNKYNFVKHLVSTTHKKVVREQGRDLMLVEKYQMLVSQLSRYRCHICSFYCNNNEDLITHMVSDDHSSMVKTLTGPMLCVQCGYIAEENEEILKHVQSEEHNTTVLQSKCPCVIKEDRYKPHCKLCGNIFSSAKSLLFHMQTKHRIKALGQQMSPDCPHCGRHFKTIFSMTLHVRRRHKKDSPFKCIQCNVGFSDIYTLNLHEMSKPHKDVLLGNKQQSRSTTTRGKSSRRVRRPKDGIFKCDHCTFRTKHYIDLQPHYLLHHPKQMFRCEDCGTSYCFQRNLDAHMKSATHQKAVLQARSASQTALSCMSCYQKFYDQKQLRLHELTHQVMESASSHKDQAKVSQPKTSSRFKSFLDSLPKGYKKATCPECGKTMSRQNLIPHLRIHENDMIFECPVCNHSYASMPSLRKHMKKHLGIKDYVCKVCGKEFYKASSYVVHKMRHDKTVKRSFKCELCDSSFYRRWELLRHIRIHTSKNIKCPFPGCRLSFANRSECVTHERTHTGEKPYLCDECGYASKTQNQLTRHRRTHTGEKNFSCEYCSYKGSNSTHLRRHMRIHIGSKPYKCPYCDYRSNTHENMRKHITKTKKHMGLKIYPCKECKFGTNEIKDFKEHVLTAHPSIYTSENSVMSAFAGLYDNKNDPRKVPEGSQALPVKERVASVDKKKAERKLATGNSSQLRDSGTSSSMEQGTASQNATSHVYSDHAYNTDGVFMRNFMKAEEITMEIVHEPAPQVWSGCEVIPGYHGYAVPQHATQVAIDPSCFVPAGTDLKAGFVVPQSELR